MKRLVEVVVLRSLPAALNLATTVLIGHRLGVVEFGVYSTVLVTLLVVANMTFGCITFSILPYYRHHMQKGQEQDYSGAAVLAGLLLAGVVMATAVAAFPFGIGPELFLVIAGFGLFTIGQELIHARMQLVRYGLVAAVQALTFLVLIFLCVDDTAASGIALLCFAASYYAGAGVSYLLGGKVSLSFSNLTVLRNTVPSGAAAALGSLAEGGMMLGVRYTLLLGGHSFELGVFAYCLDLGQRVIGSVLGAATFAYVPLAYQQDDDAAFRRTLAKAAVVGGTVAVAAAIGVYLLRIGPFALVNGPFDPIVFALCCIATSVNRLKKLAINPVMMRRRKTYLLAVPYVVAIPVAIAATSIGTVLALPYAGGIGIILSNLTVVALSVALLARSSLRTGEATP